MTKQEMQAQIEATNKKLSDTIKENTVDSNDWPTPKRNHTYRKSVSIRAFKAIK